MRFFGVKNIVLFILIWSRWTL